MTPRGAVYLIDDDASVRRAMRRLLTSAGYAVVVLESADAFLALAQAQRPLCLVVDVRMPGLTGFDLQSVLRPTEFPIVFMSGHGDADMAARAIAAGALAFLSKPVDDKLLFDAVESGLALDRERLIAQAGAQGP